MQSGKTFTAAFVAAEMLRRKKVDKIIVFCGNAEVALRDQIKKSFFGTYFIMNYLSILNKNNEIEHCGL